MYLITMTVSQLDFGYILLRATGRAMGVKRVLLIIIKLTPYHDDDDCGVEKKRECRLGEVNYGY